MHEKSDDQKLIRIAWLSLAAMLKEEISEDAKAKMEEWEKLEEMERLSELAA